MNNMAWLYGADEGFKAAVDAAAAEWLGSSSVNFAHEWLSERHDGDAGADGEIAEMHSKIAELEKECSKLRSDNLELHAENVKVRGESNGWRLKCGRMMDKAHEMLRIAEVDA